VAKNAKAVIVAVVVILASGALVAGGLVLPAAALFVVGLVGVAALHKQGTEDEVDTGGKSKLDRALEDRVTPSGPATPAAPTAPASEGLPTWRPTGGPSTPATPIPRREPAADVPEPATPSWDTWQDRGPTEELDEENPLSDLDRLDEIDPIAEVERIEGRTASGAVASSPAGSFSFSSTPQPINEAAVQTPDDVMAASEAVELHVADGEDSELARLLAKVQQRLAAYE
jgi:hypothetical protein